LAWSSPTPSFITAPNSFQNAFAGALADRLHVAAFLQQLAAHVERQVGRVDHALDEAQVSRHQRLRVVHDEDALDVQLHARALVAVVEVERRLGRDVEQLRVLAAALDLVVGVGQRRVAVVAHLLVELLVLRVGDLALGTRPQRRGLVDRLPLVGQRRLGLLAAPLFLAHQDRQRDVVRVLADDRLQLPGAGELLFAVAQVQHHVGAARGLVDRLDLELARAIARPAHALLRAQARAARLDRDAVGHDEARIEADAELADQVGVALFLVAQLGEKVARAALGDGAQVFDRLGLAHADAVVADRDRLRLGVEEDADLEVGRVLVQPGRVERGEAQLVAGVAGVRDQLAQEDFLVGVQRVGDEVQDLLDFGLEGEGLFLAHGRSVGGRIAANMRPVRIFSSPASCRPRPVRQGGSGPRRDASQRRTP
jgi:hypothetical protein